MHVFRPPIITPLFLPLNFFYSEFTAVFFSNFNFNFIPAFQLPNDHYIICYKLLGAVDMRSEVVQRKAFCTNYFIQS